jgi:hypothetical protein
LQLASAANTVASLARHVSSPVPLPAVDPRSRGAAHGAHRSLRIKIFVTNSAIASMALDLSTSDYDDILTKLESTFGYTREDIERAVQVPEAASFVRALSEIPRADPNVDYQWCAFVVLGLLMKGVYVNFTGSNHEDRLKELLSAAIGKKDSESYRYWRLQYEPHDIENAEEVYKSELDVALTECFPSDRGLDVDVMAESIEGAILGDQEMNTCFQIAGDVASSLITARTIKEFKVWTKDLSAKTVFLSRLDADDGVVDDRAEPYCRMVAHLTSVLGSFLKLDAVLPTEERATLGMRWSNKFQWLPTALRDIARAGPAIITSLEVISPTLVDLSEFATHVSNVEWTFSLKDVPVNTTRTMSSRLAGEDLFKLLHEPGGGDTQYACDRDSLLTWGGHGPDGFEDAIDQLSSRHCAVVLCIDLYDGFQSEVRAGKRVFLGAHGGAAREVGGGVYPTFAGGTKDVAPHAARHAVVLGGLKQVAAGTRVSSALTSFDETLLQTVDDGGVPVKQFARADRLFTGINSWKGAHVLIFDRAFIESRRPSFVMSSHPYQICIGADARVVENRVIAGFSSGPVESALTRAGSSCEKESLRVRLGPCIAAQRLVLAGGTEACDEFQRLRMIYGRDIDVAACAARRAVARRDAIVREALERASTLPADLDDAILSDNWERAGPLTRGRDDLTSVLAIAAKRASMRCVSELLRDGVPVDDGVILGAFHSGDLAALDVVVRHAPAGVLTAANPRLAAAAIEAFRLDVVMWLARLLAAGDLDELVGHAKKVCSLEALTALLAEDLG